MLQGWMQMLVNDNHTQFNYLSLSQVVKNFALVFSHVTGLKTNGSQLATDYVVTKTRNDLQWPTMVYNDLQYNDLLQWPTTWTYNDLQWATITYSDLQWPTMTYNEIHYKLKLANDLQWATMRALQWHTMSYNDLKWSTGTYSELQWATMTYSELQ